FRAQGRLLPQPSGRGDIGPDFLRLALDFLDAFLDHITYGDDADEQAVPLHGQVAEAAGRHDLHQLVDRMLLVADLDLGRHGRAHGKVQCGHTVLGQDPNDIALGQDTDDLAVVVGDDERANAALSENTYGFGE